MQSETTCFDNDLGLYKGCISNSVSCFPYSICCTVLASSSELNCENDSISLYCAKSIRSVPLTAFIAFVCAAPPTRDTERPTFTAE